MKKLTVPSLLVFLLALSFSSHADQRYAITDGDWYANTTAAGVTRAQTTGMTSFRDNAFDDSCTPPSISIQPSDDTICDGSAASFSVVASGSVLTYQWRL